MHRYHHFIFWIFVIIFLAGCEQTTPLFKNLPEKEVNDMLYILQKSNIKATKVAEKTGFGINVPSSEMYRSMALLKQHGYPKERFKTLEDMFPSDSLMSSDMADTLRYYKVISDDLSESISQIDGIISVRVHIVPSEAKKSGRMSGSKQVKGASGASVFIKYNPDYQIDSYVANIKAMVTNSISGLNYNNVGVFLFPETLSIYTLEGEDKSKREETKSLSTSSVSKLTGLSNDNLLTIVGSIVIILTFIVIFLLLRRKNS